MTNVHNAHRLGKINKGGPRYGASLCLTNCRVSTMVSASPARIQMIQAGQNDPSILSIGSQAVKKTENTAGKTVFRNLDFNIMTCA